jgi:hypothetical protein
MRKTFRLSDLEFRQFRNLNPFPHDAIAFWKRMAIARGCDPRSVISNGATFTALPEGHGKHWCYPIPLKCKRRSPYFEKKDHG